MAITLGLTALQVFAPTRRVLADDSGLDPSRELRGMMERIVRQDTAIGPAGVSHPLSLRQQAEFAVAYHVVRRPRAGISEAVSSR